MSEATPSNEVATPVVTNEAVGLENVATEEAKIYFVPATETFYTTEVLPYDQIPTPNVLVEKNVYDSLVEQTSTSTEKVIKADAVTGQPRVVNKETLYTIEDHKNFKLQELNLAHRNALEGTIAFKDTAFTLSDSLLFQVTVGLNRMLGTQSKLNSVMINAIVLRVNKNTEAIKRGSNEPIYDSEPIDVSAFTFGEDEYTVTLRDENGRNVTFNSSELNTFVGLIQDAYEDAHARLRTLSRAVPTATTLEQINAIAWTADYSSFLSQDELRAVTEAKTQAEERQRKRDEAERRLIDLPKELEKTEVQRRVDREKREREEHVAGLKAKSIQLSDGTWLDYVRNVQYSPVFTSKRIYSKRDEQPDWVPEGQAIYQEVGSAYGPRDERRALAYAVEKFGLEHEETQRILSAQFGTTLSYNVEHDSFIESSGEFENFDVEWSKDMVFKNFLHKGTFEPLDHPHPHYPNIDSETGRVVAPAGGVVTEQPEDNPITVHPEDGL